MRRYPSNQPVDAATASSPISTDSRNRLLCGTYRAAVANTSSGSRLDECGCDRGRREHRPVDARAAMSQARIAPGELGRQLRAAGAGVPVRVGPDHRTALLLARIELICQGVEIDGGLRDAGLRQPGEDRPFRSVRAGRHEIAEPGAGQVVTREVQPVLAQHQISDERVVDVVVGRDVADPLPHRLRPCRVEASESAIGRQPLADVVVERPVADGVQCRVEVIQRRVCLDGLAQNAPAHRTQEPGARPFLGIDDPDRCQRTGDSVGVGRRQYRRQVARLVECPAVAYRQPPGSIRQCQAAVDGGGGIPQPVPKLGRVVALLVLVVEHHSE